MIDIRNELPTDVTAIDAVTRAAFASAEHSPQHTFDAIWGRRVGMVFPIQVGDP